MASPALLHSIPTRMRSCCSCLACSLFDYLWVAEDGMKMQGYNGSQLWDTAFAVQVGPGHLSCPGTAEGRMGRVQRGKLASTAGTAHVESPCKGARLGYGASGKWASKQTACLLAS